MASEKLDMVQELANEKLQAEELEARIEKVQQEEADKQYDESILDDDLEDLAAAKAMGLKGTDAEILKRYRKELESEPKLLGENIAVYHTYESSGIFEASTSPL